MRFLPWISKIKFRKVFGDYFFLLLLISGVAVNFYFEMKVNRAIKKFTADHEKILDMRTRADHVFVLGKSMVDLESLVARFIRTGDSSYLGDIREKETKLERDIVILTQQLRQVVSDADMQELRLVLQKRVSYVQSILETYQLRGRTEATDLMFTGRGMDLQKDLSVQYERVYDHAQAEIQKLELQLKEDKKEIISVDYAMPHLITFIFLVIGGFILQKILQGIRLNKNLHEAVENEKRAQQVKDQFMDNMTHELRSPLNSVLGYTSLLLKTPLGGDQEKFVRSIRTSGEHLLNVINEVLDFSKLRSGYIKISREPFSLREQLEALGSIIRDKILEKDLFYDCHVDDTVPDHLNGDGGKLLQVLLNLTSNAVKFTKQGGITVDVRCIGQDADKVALAISVTDTGAGIPQDKLPYIFERFYQVEGGATKEHSGTGLGLSITREMLALQGGRIQVESEPGKGSTFMVEIAYELVKESDNPGSVNATVESRQLPYSMKVLVVDDNAMNRELAAFILRDLGVKYSLATGGEEALSLLMRESFDVILMDYQMPGMDGKETTKRIREELKLETPIVALSAYAQEQEKQNCLEAGMDAYLTKPVKEEELFNTLEMFAPVTNQAIVNLAHLERMSKGNPEFIDTVILKVADTLPLEIEELRNAVIDGDKQKVNMIAHNMKTTFAVLGVAELAGEALRYLESWEPTTGNIINAAKKLELIEDVGAQVTFQILDTFSDHRRKGESLLS